MLKGLDQYLLRSLLDPAVSWLQGLFGTNNFAIGKFFLILGQALTIAAAVWLMRAHVLLLPLGLVMLITSMPMLVHCTLLTGMFDHHERSGQHTSHDFYEPKPHTPEWTIVRARRAHLIALLILAILLPLQAGKLAELLPLVLTVVGALLLSLIGLYATSATTRQPDIGPGGPWAT